MSGSTGDRTYFYYHPTVWVRNALEEAGFTNLRVMEVAYPKGDEGTETHTIILAEK